MPYCGFVADRDYNAAANIHDVGMEQPFEPEEIFDFPYWGNDTSPSHLCGAGTVHEAGSHAHKARGSSLPQRSDKLIIESKGVQKNRAKGSYLTSIIMVSAC